MVYPVGVEPPLGRLFVSGGRPAAFADQSGGPEEGADMRRWLKVHWGGIPLHLAARPAKHACIHIRMHEHIHIYIHMYMYVVSYLPTNAHIYIYI